MYLYQSIENGVASMSGFIRQFTKNAKLSDVLEENMQKTDDELIVINKLSPNVVVPRTMLLLRSVYHIDSKYYIDYLRYAASDTSIINVSNAMNPLYIELLDIEELCARTIRTNYIFTGLRQNAFTNYIERTITLCVDNNNISLMLDILDNHIHSGDMYEFIIVNVMSNYANITLYEWIFENKDKYGYSDHNIVGDTLYGMRYPKYNTNAPKIMRLLLTFVDPTLIAKAIINTNNNTYYNDILFLILIGENINIDYQYLLTLNLDDKIKDIIYKVLDQV